MWNDIKAVWKESWTDAKVNWKNTWENSKLAIISALKAVAGYLLSILQTVIWMPLYTGLVKTGQIFIKWVIEKIRRA